MNDGFNLSLSDSIYYNEVVINRGLKNDNGSSMRELSLMVNSDEKILWSSKPNKLCFTLESIFNPLLPFEIVWALFDSVFLVTAFSAKGITESPAMWGIIAFMLVHLMPVWIYLGGVLTTALKYKNTAYIVTDQGVYVSTGVLSRTFQMKPFTDLSPVNIHRGIFDQFIGVGDVVFNVNPSINYSKSSRGNRLAICDIEDYQSVFKMIKNLQTDIFADTMYPNKYRPEENPGYNTKYTADYNRE